jgi:carbamoyl-phosphate synthase large subunit
MPLNVLITAGSRRVPLVRAFQSALQRLAPGGAVIVTDVNALSPAVYAADRSYQVPLATDGPAYLDALDAICRQETVGLLVPTIDDELTCLGRAQERFARIGTRVAVSPPETTLVCDDKYATCRVLRSAGVAAAESFLPGELPAAVTFPLFIKPRVGRGSVGAFAVRNARELAFFLDYVPAPVVQTFLDGPEFTIDMLCDFEGHVLSVVPRERVVVRAGVVDRSRTVAEPALTQVALRCARALPFVGAINIQCRIVGRRPIVFEINPRFSGGIPLTIAAGADFPRMLVELALDRTVPPTVGHHLKNVWMTNYDASIFLPDQAVGFSTEPRASVREVA